MTQPTNPLTDAEIIAIGLLNWHRLTDATDKFLCGRIFTDGHAYIGNQSFPDVNSLDSLRVAEDEVARRGRYARYLDELLAEVAECRTDIRTRVEEEILTHRANPSQRAAALVRVIKAMGGAK